MKGIIYYESSFEKANEELKKMVDRYNQMNISVTKCHYKRISSWVEFENGDTWQIIRANNNARGLACNIAYIERGIEKSIIDTVIKPALKAKPYTAFNFW